jgi:hypothetical protein
MSTSGIAQAAMPLQIIDSNGSSGLSQALATVGALGVYSQMNFVCCGSFQSAGGTSQLVFDILLAGPSGVTQTDISLNLLLHATSSDLSVNSAGYVSLYTSVEAQSAAGYSARQSRLESTGASGLSAGLPLPNLNGFTNMTTTPMTVSVGTPVTVTLTLTGAAVGSGATETLIMDAYNTMWFPSTGPVFTLAQGITLADIAALNIYNNALGAPPTPGGQVPEPGTLVLFGSGLLICARAWLRRR